MSDNIVIGLTGWGDHHTLYEGLPSSASKLETYAAHFPVVELDASFYAIPPASSVQKWLRETPDSFQFVVKAYQGMTGHQRGKIPFDSKEEMLEAFRKTFRPMLEAGKLSTVLCQFPPWYDCQQKYVQYIKWIREELREFPAALEFRHQSWYEEEFKKRTIDYMKQDKWIHTVVDEPQIGEKSVPFVPVVTEPDHTFIRLHGRNKAAWQKPVQGEEWRSVRYLYDYSEKELSELAEQVKKIAAESKKVTVVFNNNSGGHAAGNAKKFIQMLGLEYTGLAPKQLDLFSGD
ncbi:DUF72 domain-containing protein [Alkalicoccus halolimnae]|uniref:DUF72 domain-containing protein n=1 Tax=Alkalicoccus halolimnae TaxID=1667239 RepID=A0A5C7FIT7_9BACI|nr:DUF72 domain-containing protein [Alkalicoccus halolimnae]TXF84279.1 DUF72 domain-containing protein [Alkalicoccus halolimnae]